MSGQKYLRTNFDDDDDQLVDTLPPGVAVSGVSPLEGAAGGGGRRAVDGGGGGVGGPRAASRHGGVSVYSTTVAFGGVDSAPAVSLLNE